MRRQFLFFCFICIILSTQAQAQWPAVTEQAKPWTRWWWMGSAVDEKNISALLNTYHQAGFGGVEIVPIYGATGFERSYIPYLSPQWMKMLDYTVRQSRVLNMGVFISVGTGWPIGGPQVSINDAATKLVMQQYAITAGEPFTQKITINDAKEKTIAKLSALMAYSNRGQILDLANKVQPGGALKWIPSSGNWKLYAAFVSKTLQKVKRAAPGGEGYTLDHFSGTALRNYFKKWDTAFGANAHGVQAFYNDSYEVFNADWTPLFFREFKKRRGYDLRNYLRELVSNDTNEKTARVKTDYRETMSDLMLQNFAETFTSYAHSKKTLSLNQAHGSPGNLLDLYAAFDIPETETFGSSYFPIPGLRRDSADIRNVDPDPMMQKFASSAAHAMGRSYASSETFTWLTEHFKTSWSQCKPQVEQVFLSGINHVFYHGTTYSPDFVKWPGWLFYASVEFVPANSLWSHLKGLNEYITRCQTVLQSGTPDNEILAYWPVYDVWNNPKGMDMPLKVHDVDVWLHRGAFYKNMTALQNAGYSVDFASDKMLQQALMANGELQVTKSGATHKILLISQCTMMPEATLQNIIRLAKDGAIVIMQAFPKDVPGLYHFEERRKKLKELIESLKLRNKAAGLKEVLMGKGKIIVANDVVKALQYAGIQKETLTDDGLKFIRRKIKDGKYYYIVNHTPKAIDKNITIAFKAGSVVILDPQTGEAGIAAVTKKQNGTSVHIQLQSGEAVILKATKNNRGNSKKWNYITAAQTPITLNGNWQLHFKEGGPVLPADKTLQQLQPWTDITGDSTTQNFSGIGGYSSTFNLPEKNAPEYLLRLDKVYESAKVFINGKEAGILWSIPFQARIGKYLKQGQNTISIEVANLMANRIRYMDRNGIEWRKYHEINFVNIDYKNFDASKWKVQPSGLGGPVTIIPVAVSTN